MIGAWRTSAFPAGLIILGGGVAIFLSYLLVRRHRNYVRLREIARRGFEVLRDALDQLDWKAINDLLDQGQSAATSLENLLWLIRGLPRDARLEYESTAREEASKADPLLSQLADLKSGYEAMETSVLHVPVEGIGQFEEETLSRFTAERQRVAHVQEHLQGVLQEARQSLPIEPSR